MQESQSDTQDIRVEDYIRILFWNKWLIAAIVVVAVLVALLINDLAPPFYRAEGTIWVQEGSQQSLPFLSEMLIPGLGQQTELQTFSEIIMSRAIVPDAVQKLREAGLLEPLPVHRGKTVTWTAGLLGRQPSEKTEQGDLSIEEWESLMVRNLLKERLRAEPSRHSDLITISVEERTPERARDLVNKTSEVFQEYIKEDRRRNWDATETFAKETLPDFETALKDAEERLRDFQVKNETINLDAEAEMIIQNIGQLDSQRIVLLQSRAGAAGTLEVLTTEASKLTKTVISAEQLTDNPIVAAFQQKLSNDRIELAGLELQYPFGHLSIERLKARIAQTETEIRDEDEQRITSKTTTLNPIHQGLTEQMIGVLATIRQVNNKIMVLDEKIATYNKLIAEWPDKQLELGRLKRELLLAVQLYQTLAQTQQEARLVKEAELGSVKILEQAILPEHPISPRKTLNLALGLLIGLVLGVGVAFLRDYFDNTYPTLKDALQQLEALPAPPVFLGVVPVIADNGEHRVALVTFDSPKSNIAEAFRIIRTKLQFLNPGTPIRTILVTSATSGEGKSTVSSNFVVTLAQMNKKVLLIDADMRRPTQHKTFVSTQQVQTQPQLPSDTAGDSNGGDSNGGESAGALQLSPSERRKPGLSEFLIQMDDDNFGEILRSIVKKTEIENLDLITSGSIPPNPAELLNSEALAKFVERAQEVYDFVVFDSPPIHAVADPTILSNVVDAVIIVFSTGTKRFDILRGIESLTGSVSNTVGSKNVGVLCNRASSHYSGYYGYGQYDYGSHDEDEDNNS